MADSPAQPANKSGRPTRPTSLRMRRDLLFRLLCIGATGLAILILLVLLVSILTQGLGGLDMGFLSSGNSSQAEKAGVRTALFGTIMITAICALTAIPLGVGTAVLIEEFRPRHPLLIRLHSAIETNIRNLAGVPSIVYGILGASAFAMMFGVFGPMGNDRYAVGQQWYDLYQGENRAVYYAARSGSLESDPELRPATPDLELYPSRRLGQPVKDLTWVQKEQMLPRRIAIQADMERFEQALRKGVKATRESRLGPPRIDEEQARRIVDEALAAVQWQADTRVFREELIDKVEALDGLAFREFINEQNRAIAVAVDAEYARRMPDTMMVGRLPVRVDKKAWYYFALPLGRGVLAGGLTLMLVILPIVIVASQEALRAVPGSYRQGALALGATKWQSVSKTALPAAIPGICTGTILAISRAIGEAAPILVLGGAGYVTSSPQNLMDRFSALPMTIYKWSGLPDLAFQEVAAAGIIVLLVVLLSFNALAIFIRHRAARHQ